MPYRNEKLKEFLRTPLGMGTAIIASIVLLVLIIFSIVQVGTGSNEIRAEYDPASEEEVYFAPATNGAESEDIVRYVGFFDLFRKNNVTPEQYVNFQNTMEEYAKNAGIYLTRVSYVKDSLYIEGTCKYNLDAVLNVDEVLLNVVMDASENCEGTDGLKIKISEVEE
ncbi:hypothetical protein IKG33_03315 [Candidatus Saccharibacteria bacterium]|nr:hypothetical protein [Candidatus Saccharibacteria bacterium]